MPTTSTVLATCLLILFTSTAWGQARFEPYALGERPLGIAKEVAHIRAVAPNPAEMERIRSQSPKELVLVLPLPNGQTVRIGMERSGVVPAGQRIRQTGNRPVGHVDGGLHYQTPRKADLGALSFFKHEDGKHQIAGLFRHEGVNYVIGPDSLGRLVVFPEAEMPGQNPFTCHTDDLPLPTPSQERPVPGAPDGPAACPRSIKFHVEADFQTFVDNGSSLGRTVAWINSVWNVVGRVYLGLDIPIEVTEIYIHTLPDNWPSAPTHSGLVLVAFNDSLRRRGWEGDLAHLVSTRPLGQGGVGGLAGVCNPAYRGAAYSNCNYTYKQLPAYSWTITVISHEIGHNFGSNHTHWCGWELAPGVFGTIDSCVAAQNFTGPPCHNSTRARAGTIMSYCHTNGSVDLALGFGPLPGAVLQQTYRNGLCLTPATSSIDVAYNPVDTACQGEPLRLSVQAPAGSTFQWSGPGGFISQEQSPQIASFSSGQAGDYAVIVTNAGCSTRPLTTQVVENCIPSTALDNGPFCPEDGLSVSYKARFPLQPGNEFQVELSDAAGVFAGNPPIVGTLASASRRGEIPVTLPLGLGLGSGYRFRVRSSQPVRSGIESAGPVLVQGASAAPATTGATRSTPGTLELQAVPPAGMSNFWYEDSLSAMSLAEGPTFLTPFLSATRRYWAQARSANNQRVGMATSAGATATYVNAVGYGMNFTVLAPMVLDSLRVIGAPGTIAYSIRSLDQGRIVHTGTLAAARNAGAKNLIGVILEPGHYQITREFSPGGQGLHRVESPTFLPYPYTITGLVSIQSAITTAGSEMKHWCFFYDWKVRPYVCPSARVPVTAAICLPPGPAAPILTYADDTLRSSYPGPHLWLLNGTRTGHTGRYVPHPSGGSWSAISLLTPCHSDTSATVVVLPVSIRKHSTAGVRVLPNPARDALYLQSHEAYTRYTIADVLGRPLRQGAVAPTLPLGSLPPGVYFLKLTGSSRAAEMVRFEKM